MSRIVLQFEIRGTIKMDRKRMHRGIVLAVEEEKVDYENEY